MKHLILVLSILMVMAFSQNIFASILIEPYAGYSLGNFNDGVSEEDANGAAYGLRIGYEIPILWFALDYMASKQTVDFPSGSKDGTASRFGVVVGATAPLGVRVWAGYYFIDEYSIKVPAASSEVDFEGTGVKVGIGFRLIPLLHLNFEYITSDYDKETLTGAAADATGLVVSLSIPLSI